LVRTRSLNAGEGLLDALENVARPLLGETTSGSAPPIP
jgi:hypothetical protein